MRIKENEHAVCCDNQSLGTCHHTATGDALWLFMAGLAGAGIAITLTVLAQVTATALPILLSWLW